MDSEAGVSSLELNPEEFRRLGHSLVDALADHYRALPGLPVTPGTSAAQLTDLLRHPAPDQPGDPDALLRQVLADVYTNSRHNGHPGFFGYVASPGTPTAALGDLLISVLNTNVTGWRSAPAGVTIEQTVIDWIREWTGMPESAGGLFVSGGSMANFAGLAAARSALFPDVRERGLAGRPARIYASSEVHLSIPKAAAMLGLGSEAVRLLPCDRNMRLDPGMLDEAMREDIAAGMQPMCVVASAGTAGTGAVDPLAAIGNVARRYNAWFHIDASYGGFAVLAPSVRHLFDGMEAADSISLDPHKWLYLPLDCGCVIYRNPEVATRAFAYQAEYTRAVGLQGAEAFAYWDYGPELSRRFRALNVWLQVQTAGLDAIREGIDRNIACARYVEQLITDSEDFEMLCPTELSIFCFRYHPPGYTGDLDDLNHRMLTRVQKSGHSYVSNASVHGQFALRGCVLNYRTEERHMQLLLEEIRNK
jgi:aromatic-L-amino-acid/L-tryptophan decarboxylase